MHSTRTTKNEVMQLTAMISISYACTGCSGKPVPLLDCKIIQYSPSIVPFRFPINNKPMINRHASGFCRMIHERCAESSLHQAACWIKYRLWLHFSSASWINLSVLKKPIKSGIIPAIARRSSHHHLHNHAIYPFGFLLYQPIGYQFVHCGGLQDSFNNL